jgi:hypothetical protein
MMYNISDYCFCFGLFPLPGTLKNSVSETGSICPQVRGWEAHTLLGPLETPNLNHRIHLCLLYNSLLTSVDEP